MTKRVTKKRKRSSTFHTCFSLHGSLDYGKSHIVSYVVAEWDFLNLLSILTHINQNEVIGILKDITNCQRVQSICSMPCSMPCWDHKTQRNMERIIKLDRWEQRIRRECSSFHSHTPQHHSQWAGLPLSVGKIHFKP